MIRMPPYADLLGLVVEQDEAGAPGLMMPFATDVLGRPGSLHGGAISGLMEMAAIVALYDALEGEGGGEIKPINVTVDFMRGGRDKETRSRGVITRLGTRVANVEAIAWQDDPGKPVAAAPQKYSV